MAMLEFKKGNIFFIELHPPDSKEKCVQCLKKRLCEWHNCWGDYKPFCKSCASPGKLKLVKSKKDTPIH